MKDQDQATDAKRQSLETLVVDNRDLDRLEELLGEFNLFDAIGARRQELRHSAFLGFLLDPAGNHGLGDHFLKTLFKRCLTGSSGQQIGAIDIDVADLADAVVEREKWNIDVLVLSEHSRFAIAIENKVDSGEHDNQLNRYREIVAREFPGYRTALIFLTPDGDAPSEPEREYWLPLSYAAVADAIRTVREARYTTLGDAVEVSLRHYETMVGRHVVSNSEIARLCQQIYKQHKEALDLIFEHLPDQQTELKELLEKEVQAQSGYVLDHCTKSAIRFAPSTWDTDPRQLGGAGWTPTKRVVLFEITNGRNFIRLKLVVGPVRDGDPAAVSLREAVFSCAKKHRSDFPNGGTTLAPRYTTVLSRDLVKQKDYPSLEEDPEKASRELRSAFQHEIPRAVERLRGVLPRDQGSV